MEKIFIGAHIGPYLIRVSQYYEGLDAPEIQDLKKTAYGIEEWFSMYQGSLPNLFNAEERTFGYGALTSGSVSGLQRIDQGFFQAILNNQVSATPKLGLWRGFLDEVRRLIRERVPMHLTLYLEGMDFVGPRNRFAPWKKPVDYRPSLEALLLEPVRRYGVDSVCIARPADTLAAWAKTTPGVVAGDVVLDIGNEEAVLWQLAMRENKLSPEPVNKSLGYGAILASGINGANASTDQFLRWIADSDARNWNGYQGLAQWREQLQSDLKTGRARLRGAGDCYLVGDGYQLASAISETRTIDNAEFAHSRGAAVLSFAYDREQA